MISSEEKIKARRITIEYIRTYLAHTDEEKLEDIDLINLYLDEFNLAMALFQIGYNMGKRMPLTGEELTIKL